MRVSERMKKWISMALCLCMLVQNCPVVAFAAEDNLCTHHPEHTAECHYAQGSAGAPCTHVHDAECGYREAVAEVKCACEATDENGALVHTEGCGYVAPVTGADCAHVHDDSCGYAAAVEAHECHYECAECANNELSSRTSPQTGVAIPEGDAQNQKIATSAPNRDLLAMTEAVCDCGTDDPAVHATTCDAYVAPENPQCFCAEACGVEAQNIWCDVCGFDYTACLGRDTAAAYVTMTGGEKLYLKPNANWLVDNARFAIYVFGTGNAWASMTDSDSDGIYEVEVPAGSWTNVIFCRMNPSAAANSWDNKWNQTGDLTYDGTNDLFTIPDGSWDGTTTGWSKMPVPVPDPVCTCETKCAEGSVNSECAVCSAEGADLTGCIGEACEHTFNTAGTCTVCGEQAAAKIGETYYLTLAQAAAKVTEGGTIQVLTDVTIGEDETVTFAAFATLDVAEGKTVTCDGTVKIGDKDGIIFANTLYYYGGDVTNAKVVIPGTGKPYYFKAGEGYIIGTSTGSGDTDTDTMKLVNATVNSTDGDGIIGATLTISFSGINTITATGGEENIGIYSYWTGEGVGKHVILSGEQGAVLNISAGDATGVSRGIYAQSVTITGGTVNVTSGNAGQQSVAINASESVTVEEGATLNLTFGEAPFSCGAFVLRNEGTINGLIAVPDDNTLGMAFATSGNTVLVADFASSVDGQAAIPFSVPADTSLTVSEGVTVDLSMLEVDDIDFSGDVYNNGTILLPEGFGIPGTLTGGTVTIGDKTYLWSSENEKWICAEGSHVTELEENKATCAKAAICDLCGASYGEVDKTKHDSSVECVNGFCENGCYEPATDYNADGVYEIYNAGQLFWFAQQVNEEGNKEIKGTLRADIDLENRPWTPIGAMGEENSFRGVFDGQNYTIRGLNVEGSENGVGFFGEVRTGTVKNFTIFGNVVVNTEVNYVGGVIGSICGVNGETSIEERNGAVIQNITSYVNVTAKAHGIGMIGGFVGHADHQSLIEQCSWYGTFDAGSYLVDSGAGGFIGKIQENTGEVTIRNCGAYGTIKTSYAGDISIGGFIGLSDTGAKTTIENSLFAGRFERGENLTGAAELAAFGTLRSVNAIKNCYYLGDDGLAAVHSDSDLKPGSDNVEITSVTGEELKSGVIATRLGDLWAQGENYPVPKKDEGEHSHSYTYADNGDGTHDKVCDMCPYVEVDNEPHTIENHVCTACGAMEIVVSFNAGDFEWKTGDKLYFCRVSGDNEWEEYAFTATVAGDGTVTWTPDRTLYWDGTGEHKLVVIYPDTGYVWDIWYIDEDQSTLENLRKNDHLNSIWSGNPTTDTITFNLKHRLAKVTVNYEAAEGVTVSKAEVYTLTQYLLFDIHTLERKNVAWEEGHDLWINSYHNGNQFTAFVSPDAYAADGNFIKITLSDGSVREVKMNKAVTFEEGAEYTYTVVITADGAYLTCADECTFEYTDNGDGTHNKVCSECGYVAASEAHSGGTATCTEQAECQHCGASYGAVDKTNHDTENAEYDNGFCPYCDAFEPAELVDGVYEISNAGNLYWFADKVTNENAAYGSADAILTCDIRVNSGTMTEASTGARVWTPIGKIGLVGNQVVRYPYTGTFEGNGKTVSGLYFNDTSANFDVGLFSYVGEGGTVQNVGIADSYLCGSQSIGAVVGNNFGTVTGCYNTGTVISSGTAGGVVGANNGTVTGCYNTGTVSGTDSVGGVVGSSRGSYTYGSGSIKSNAIVTDCYNTGAVSGTTDVGGVVGYTGAYYSSSSGIVFSTAIVTDCHNTGTVSGKNNVGGVVGAHSGIVTGCYNTGTVSGTSDVGGVVAYNNGIVMDCYHSGSISGTTNIGGVVGYNTSDTGTVTNCYFDSTVYTGDAIGTNEGTATNVEGKSTEQFASGEVAYLLSQGENGSIWGQDLDNGKSVQTTPTFTGAKVYCGYTSCGDTAAKYTNDETISAEKPDHTQKPTYIDNGNGTHSAVYPCCGTKGQPENHTLTYTANGNIITASCSANCGYGGTATISATDKTYDGNAVEVVVSKTGSLENTDIPVTLTKDGEAFTGEPVNAGTYTASVTLGDKTVSVDFTIAKADAIIALAPTPNSGLTYTGEAQYLINPGSAEGGILVYSLSENGDLYETIPQGTDAGEYRVWYFVQGDENHNDSARDSVPVTIEKATVTVTADAKTKTYGDADPELTYTASGLFGEDKLTGALTRAEGENVGSYAITQGTLTAGDNYTISFTGAEFAIGVKDVDVTTMEVEVTLEQDSYAYDGTAKEPEVTSIIVDGVKLTEDVDYRVLSYERNIYVGEAEVVIAFMGNYRGPLSRFFQITKAPLTVTADNKTMITGQELPTFTYTITGFVNGETEDVLTAKPTVSCEADGKTAGTYGITVSGAAADNYEITHVNGTLTVADHQHAWTYTAEGDTITAICGNGSTCPEAEQTITICAEGKIYDGKPVTAELDGSIEGVDDPEITYSGNTDAGTYTASIKLGKATASVEFTIEKATPTVAWANTSESVNYTGVAAVITAPTVTLVNGEPFGGTISYAHTGTSSGSGLPTNAGTYEITASIDAQGSYNAAASTNKLTLTINKVDPVYTVPTGLTATYGDTLADVALPEGFRWTDSSESVGAVGTKNTTVIYTPADTANYNTVTNIAVSVAVKAAAATVTAAPTPNDLTYTGEAQELITAGEAEGGTMQYQLNGGEWSDKIPTAKDEGTYTVSWKVVGDANHADTEVKSITVTIGDCTHADNTNRDDADCTTQVTCSVCGDVLVEAKAHVWADWTTTLEPTTTTEGSKERLCTNDGCEAKDTKSIPMLNEVEVPKPEGGDVSVDNPTPATGEDVTITVTPDTGKEVVDVVVRDKNDNEITVTKNEDGTYTYEQPDSDVTVEVILKDTIYTVTWTVDGKTYAEQTYKYGEHITAPADPTKAQSGCTVYTFHKWNGFTAGMTMPDEKELTFAAEFTEEGSHIDDDQNHICDRECGKTDIGLHADAADDKDHVCDYGCGEVLETCSGGTATCMAEAVCAVCGESYGSKDPQNHTGSTHVENAEDPTCAEPGYTGDTVCECGETIGAGEQIPATGEHDYHNGTCSVCGGKDPNYNKPGWGGIWDWIFGGWWGQGNKCDHSYTAVVTAPTCTEKGYTTYTCSKCGDCYKDSYTNALGHAWDKGVVTKEPTCTENGVKTYTCGRCGHQKTETIQATGHNYQNGICGGCGAQKPTEPSVPDKPDKPNKPVWGGIWDWIFGGWWK